MQFRNPNLIYIDGKPYKESDLKDMIQYYHQNYQPTLPITYNQFPSDATAEILKNYPFYPSISSKTYRPNLFYEQYCGLEPTFKEFLNYVETKPQRFQLYFPIHYTDGNSFDYWDFTKQDDLYEVTTVSLNMEHQLFDIDIFHVDDILSYIINQYKRVTGEFLQIRYDLNTLTEIYQRRTQCVQYNPSYANQMSNKYLQTVIANISIVNSYDSYVQYLFDYHYLSGTAALLYNEPLVIDNDMLSIVIFQDNTVLDLTMFEQLMDEYYIDDILTKLNQLKK